MDTRDRLNGAKIILTGLVGSHSYGTATGTSDTDYMSVVIAPEDTYLGLSDWGSSGTVEVEYDDAERGFVEHKYYELRKFIGMCQGMNPNAIPLLWLEPSHYSAMTPAGAMLILNREIFNSKRVYYTFSGYAHGQLQKMGGVFNDLEQPNKLLRKGHQKFQDWAEYEIGVERRFRDLAVRAKNGTLTDSDREDLSYRTRNGLRVEYDEGWLNALLALKTHSKEEIKRIKDGPITGRMGKERKELREQFGYDVKFAFHTIRLLRMAVEFLTHPEEGLKVYRKGIDDDFLYSIRTGALVQDEVKAMANDLFEQAKQAASISPLANEPDRDAINRLCVDILRFSFNPPTDKCD